MYITLEIGRIIFPIKNSMSSNVTSTKVGSLIYIRRSIVLTSVEGIHDGCVVAGVLKPQNMSKFVSGNLTKNLLQLGTLQNG